MSQRIAVIGAGIVGCCIAYALRKRGADVTLIDRDEPGHGASFGNSGAISQGSVAPLAMPGIVASVPAMLSDPDGALRLPLAYLPKALPWLLRFVASSTPKRVEAIAARLAVLHAGAIDLHQQLSREVGVAELFSQRGHLHLYRDAAAIDADAASWRLRRQHGCHVERLDRSGILALEPRISARYQAALFLPDHATILNPLRYVQAIARAFTLAGGSVLRSAVNAIAPQADGSWRLGLDAADAPPAAAFAHVVVAAGAWSRRLLDPLGVRVALESQRGYHLQFGGARSLVSRSVVLVDRKVFVTPMEDGLRLGGTVEIAGLERPPDPRRYAVLRRAAGEAFESPEDRLRLERCGQTEWMGHRPCMPDSVPVIGPAPGHRGLWLALGHGHLGLTTSIKTGQMLADALAGAAVRA